MQQSLGLEHLLTVAFMGLASCNAVQGQEQKGSSEIVQPNYPQIPEFPMKSPNEVVQTPNVAIYPAPQKVDVPAVSEEKPSVEEGLVGTYEIYVAPSPPTTVPRYGNVQSFHATKDNIRQPKDTTELSLVLLGMQSWEQHYSSEPLQIPALKPGIYEVRNASLTRFLVVEEGGIVVGTMSYRNK